MLPVTSVWPGCCTDVVGLIPRPDTCDRQHLGQELHWWHYSQKCVGLVCPPQLPYQTNNKTLTPNPKSGCNGNAFPTKLTLSGPGPVKCRMRDNGCGLHDDSKFWDCRTSGQFPNWNFVRLGSLVVKCPGWFPGQTLIIINYISYQWNWIYRWNSTNIVRQIHSKIRNCGQYTKALLAKFLFTRHLSCFTLHQL